MVVSISSVVKSILLIFDYPERRSTLLVFQKEEKDGQLLIKGRHGEASCHLKGLGRLWIALPKDSAIRRLLMQLWDFTIFGTSYGPTSSAHNFYGPLHASLV